MAIATHPLIANGQHVNHLPPSWTTRYELTTKLGELLIALPKAKAGVKGRTRKLDGVRADPSNSALSFADLGIPVLSKTNQGSLLPPSWGTLYELACLPEPT